MEEILANRSFEDFVAVLAAKEPVPGGGGAAALAGALGVALCSMVGNYTSGKKTYAAVEEDVQRMLGEAENVRKRLVQLVREDAAAFLPLSKAYAIPRDNPERAAILEEATKLACAAPMQMMREICHAIELLEEMGQKGSKMLASDVGCGALLCRAALEAASLNVFVNTRTLKDRSYAELMEQEVDHMLNVFVPRAEACAKLVMDGIRGR